MEYRKIKLADNVKLYKKDGNYNEMIKRGLDVLADILFEKSHELVSEYVDDRVKILIDFKCGHISHWITPNQYKRGKGCPKCKGVCSIQAEEEFYVLVNNNEHLLLSEYKNSKTKVLINFNCGHDPNLITPNSYKKGSGCPICGDIQTARIRLEHSKMEFIELVESNGHQLLSEYTGAKNKVLIDLNCSHKPNWVLASSYKNGHRCFKCGINISSDSKHKQANQKLKKLIENNGHLLLSEYQSAKVKVLVDFNCGHDAHLITPNNYRNGYGCPICNESKGEKRVRKFLFENNIRFMSQIEYDGLIGIGGGNLSYDFYLSDNNLLIEYQGEFHDGHREYTSSNLINQKEHDKRKLEYAKLNNMRLLEIWYWDFDNIEKILERELII